ncbi:hypothetical protein [Paenibacillus dendrobii]|uniref:hypothetical protein n=1 Tax=Paenibacillus dendrobii TaxID=2691084 RepID=UPI001F2AB0ED|nr:hypothetical protein [Paenibacillus dendrobii]
MKQKKSKHCLTFKIQHPLKARKERMSKYAIAYMNYLDNIHLVKIIEADGELEALRNVLDLSSDEFDFKTVEEVMCYCFSIDLSVSIPVLLVE